MSPQVSKYTGAGLRSRVTSAEPRPSDVPPSARRLTHTGTFTLERKRRNWTHGMVHAVLYGHGCNRTERDGTLANVKKLVGQQRAGTSLLLQMSVLLFLAKDARSCFNVAAELCSHVSNGRAAIGRCCVYFKAVLQQAIRVRSALETRPPLSKASFARGVNHSS